MGQKKPDPNPKMDDSTLLALAGTALALLFFSGGSATVSRVNNRLNTLADIYHESFEGGFDPTWQPKDCAQVSFCMNGMLAIAEGILQKQDDIHQMTKRDLMNIVRIDIGDYDNGSVYFIQKLRNWAALFDEKTASFMDGPLEVHPRMVPPVKEFVDQAITLLQESLTLISDIFQLLPDESVHSARALVSKQSDDLIRLKFTL